MKRRKFRFWASNFAFQMNVLSLGLYPILEITLRSSTSSWDVWKFPRKEFVFNCIFNFYCKFGLNRGEFILFSIKDWNWSIFSFLIQLIWLNLYLCELSLLELEFFRIILFVGGSGRICIQEKVLRWTFLFQQFRTKSIKFRKLLLRIKIKAFWNDWKVWNFGGYRIKIMVNRSLILFQMTTKIFAFCIEKRK